MSEPNDKAFTPANNSHLSTTASLAISLGWLLFAGWTVYSGSIKRHPKMSEPNDRAIMKMRQQLTAVEGLRFAQTNTAYYLEIALLAAAEHPHIAKTEPEIVQAAFEEIKKIGNEMSVVTNEITERYHKIQTDVQNIIGDVTIRKGDLQKELGKLKLERGEAELEVKLADDTVQRQEAGRKKFTEEYDRLCREKEEFVKQWSKSMDFDRTTDSSSDFITGMLFPGMAVTGMVSAGIVAAVCPPMALLAVPAVVGGAGALALGANAWNENRKADHKADHMVKAAGAMNAAEKQIQDLHQAERQYNMQLVEYKKVQLEKIHKVKMLTLQEGNIGDLSALDEVSTDLGEVYAQFQRLKSFWDNIVVCIDLLNKDTNANWIYRKALPHLKDKIEASEQKWSIFSQTCETYTRVCDKGTEEGIHVLYRFLSMPMDSMSKVERQNRRDVLTSALTKRVESL